jgi:hypothetical protein
VDIKDWNELLFEQLVLPGRPGRRLYLYVDRAVLADASAIEDGDVATADFCAAFTAVSGPEPFARSWRDGLAWRRGGWPGTPPVVAALSMTVLAVTDDPLGGTHGVYRRQNDLLGLTAEARPPAGYDLHVPGLWQLWNQWLLGPGSRYGRPSARTHPHWTLQGWARSQGLVRYRDRLVLEDFFSSAHVGPGDAQDPRQLTSDFLTWLTYRGAWASDLLNRFADGAAQSVLKDVIEDEAARWDGVGRRLASSGVKRLQGRLFYDTWDDTFQVGVDVDERATGDPVDVGGGERITLDGTEGVVVVDTAEPPHHLLLDGVRRELRPGLLLTLTPAPVFVLAEDTLLGGLLQVRGQMSTTTFVLLVRDSFLPDLEQALGDHLQGCRRRHTLEGWTWIDGVRPVADRASLRALGLGGLSGLRDVAPSLQGGLPVGQATYLVGGEPDLFLPAGVSASGAGVQVAATSTAQMVRLADECPPSGAHLLECSDSMTLRWTTVDFIRERAEGPPVVWALSPEPRLLAAGSTEPCGPTLAGALMRGTSAPGRLNARLLRNQEALVVDEHGAVYQVFPETEKWLARLGLAPDAVDVLRTVRSMDPRPTFFLVRTPRTGRIDAVEVPTTVDLVPGTVQRAPRPELLTDVLGAWHWLGTANEGRRRTVLSQVLNRRTERALPSPSPRRVSPPAPEPRQDVVDGQMSANPYDDLLAWISEQEKLRVSFSQFADTWAWLCQRHGLPEVAGDWRLALHRLTALGFIERDYSRQRVHVAPAAAVPLPSAGGLQLLTGARPLRLLERMDDADDPDELVAEAVQTWVLHRRSPLDDQGRPAAPTIIYLETDPGNAGTTEGGLHRLGVSRSTCTGDLLLDQLPSVQHILRSAQELTISPGGRTSHREDTPEGMRWVPRGSDLASGLHRYRLVRGTFFAWREPSTRRLFRVDRYTGSWLDEHRNGRTKHLRHDLVQRTLLVPAGLPLPPLLLRALVLRTGFMPARREQLEGHGTRHHAHVCFENVDLRTADLVASRLGQDLQSVTT